MKIKLTRLLAFAIILSMLPTTVSARVNDDDIDSLRISILEDTPFRRIRDLYLFGKLDIYLSEDAIFGDLDRDLASRTDLSGITPMTTEEYEALIISAEDWDMWILQEKVAELMTYYRAQLGLGPVVANREVARFAQEHADMWSEAISLGEVERVDNIRWKNTKLGITLSSQHDRPSGEPLDTRLRNQVAELRRLGYTVNAGGENIGIAGIRSGDWYPGDIESAARSILLVGSSTHFRNWMSRPSTEEQPLLIGFGYYRSLNAVNSQSSANFVLKMFN
ncbi:MAG: hypothetical protein FWG64_08585 [Firmicutes bacterium]|nr:hypothetical protein [Bacillota bacterium]